MNLSTRLPAGEGKGLQTTATNQLEECVEVSALAAGRHHELRCRSHVQRRASGLSRQSGHPSWRIPRVSRRCPQRPNAEQACRPGQHRWLHGSEPPWELTEERLLALIDQHHRGDTVRMAHLVIPRVEAAERMTDEDDRILDVEGTKDLVKVLHHRVGSEPGSLQA